MTLARVNRLYRDFRDRQPKRVRAVRVSTPKAVMVMGYLDFLGYSTTQHEGAMAYKHTFKSGSKPLLCSDGKRLYVLEGRYHVTERGIVDLDLLGRERE